MEIEELESGFIEIKLSEANYKKLITWLDKSAKPNVELGKTLKSKSPWDK